MLDILLAPVLEHIGVCTCVGGYGCMYMFTQKPIRSILLYHTPLCFLKQDFSLKMDLGEWLCWLASEPLGSSCPCLTVLGPQECTTRLLYCVSDSESVPHAQAASTLPTKTSL